MTATLLQLDPTVRRDQKAVHSFGIFDELGDRAVKHHLVLCVSKSIISVSGVYPGGTVFCYARDNSNVIA